MCPLPFNPNSVLFLSYQAASRAIHNDLERYPEPDTFRSSRYLDKDLSAAEYIVTNDPYERDHFAYGAGRFVSLLCVPLI